MRDKVGKFRLDTKTVLNSTPLMSSLFTKMEFVPYRAECLLAEDKVEYVGMSPMFPEVELGEDVPEYELTYKYKDDEVLSVILTHRYTGSPVLTKESGPLPSI